MHKILVSLCIPVYNEEQTIAEVVEEAVSEMSALGVSYEILVCNDGSTDETAKILNSIARQCSTLRILENEVNRGINYTFERLYLEAEGEFVFLNSADRQWPMSIIEPMLKLTDSFDIVIASRKDKHYGMLRSIVSWSFNTIPWILFGVQTFDAGAAKLVRKEIIKRFNLISKSPFSEAERIIRAINAGYRVGEYRVDVLSRRHGKARGVNLRLVAGSVRDVFRVWFDLKASKR